MPVVGLDDFSNSSPEVLRRLEALGADVSRFAQVDVTDGAALAQVFARWPIEAVVHFAAKKAVGQSVARPLATTPTTSAARSPSPRRCRRTAASE
jgi:UDP-glucose 4-epimerase